MLLRVHCVHVDNVNEYTTNVFALYILLDYVYLHRASLSGELQARRHTAPRVPTAPWVGHPHPEGQPAGDAAA